jgi:FkbM family methyltransferase
MGDWTRWPPPFRTFVGILHESAGAVRIVGDLRSLIRLLVDILLFRVLGLFSIPGRNRDREIRLKDGTRIVYRLNRGDIQSIREVWMDEVYRLPSPILPGVVIDLGANIGLTSLWLARRHAPTRVIAVEPSPQNARLVRLNLSRNGVPATVVEAAAGARDGTARFSASADSNQGQLGEDGEEVPVISMSTLLREHAPGQSVALMKMDIEGGEQDLLSSNTEWLSRIPVVLAEFHPDRVDYPGLIGKLESAGFVYHRPDHRVLFMDCFTRTGG